MIMTKEALQENYTSYIKGVDEVQDNIDMVFGLCTIATIIVLIVAVLAAILKRDLLHIGIGLVLLLFMWGIVGLFFLFIGELNPADDSKIEYKINTIMPYLFNNEETADTLKRFDNIDIQIDQNELLNTGIIKGQVIVNDNGKEIIYSFNQITLGVTSGDTSYLEVNTMDVELNKDYPKGKIINVLYLNDVDYMTFMNLFGEIPIRIEK